MRLIIDIDEEDYKIMKHNVVVNNPLCPIGQKEMVTKIANGIPLPKSHGNLIDEKDLRQLVSDYTEYDAVQIILAGREDYLPTIIEADKAEREDKE